MSIQIKNEEICNELDYTQINNLTNKFKKLTETIDDTCDSIMKVFSDIEVFSEKIAELTKPLEKYKRINSANKKLGENQFVFWDYLDESMISIILDDVHCFVSEYYCDEKINDTIQNCKQNPLIKPYERLFLQSVSSYKRQQYQISIMGFLAITDALLSDVSGNITTTGIYKRTQEILQKISDEDSLTEDEFSHCSLYITLNAMSKSISTNTYKFYGDEPKLLNRHWIMHGRTKKAITQLDCIKIINFIYGILLLDELK